MFWEKMGMRIVSELPGFRDNRIRNIEILLYMIVHLHLSLVSQACTRSFTSFRFFSKLQMLQTIITAFFLHLFQQISKLLRTPTKQVTKFLSSLFHLILPLNTLLSTLSANVTTFDCSLSIILFIFPPSSSLPWKFANSHDCLPASCSDKLY